MHDELADERATGELHPPSAGRWPLREYCIALLAGGLGERRAGAAVNDGDWHDIWSCEQLLAAALDKPAYGQDVWRMRQTLSRAASRLLDKNWTWIRRTANALRKRGALSGADVERLKD